jgi:hypothetical protein
MSGGVFVEPVQRASPGESVVAVTVLLPRAEWLLLERLFDDVPGYVTRLVAGHVRGLKKSSAYNSVKRKEGCDD